MYNHKGMLWAGNNIEPIQYSLNT